MITLVLGGSNPFVDIADARGEVFTYMLGPCRPGLDEWAIWVWHEDGTEDRRYRTGIDVAGLWRCTCADWRYRHRPGPNGCKHVEAAKQILSFVEAMR